MFEHSPEQMQQLADSAVAAIQSLRAIRDNTALAAYLRAIAQQQLDMLASNLRGV